MIDAMAKDLTNRIFATSGDGLEKLHGWHAARHVEHMIAEAIGLARMRALEHAAQIAEANIVEYSAIDEPDRRPERIRIAARIRLAASEPAK